MRIDPDHHHRHDWHLLPLPEGEDPWRARPIPGITPALVHLFMSHVMARPATLQHRHGRYATAHREISIPSVAAPQQPEILKTPPAPCLPPCLP
jgi:hypothetical protein